MSSLPLTGAGPSAAGGYSSKLLAYSPISYWIQGEASGLTAIDEINSPAQDGTYTGVTLGQPGIGDGNTCPLYDGVNDYTDIYSAAFAGAFSGTIGTIAGWMKMSGVGVWSDGSPHRIMYIRGDANNDVSILKAGANNRLQAIYRTGGANHIANADGYSSTDWIHLLLTFADSANGAQAIIYVDGSAIGVPVAVATAWGAVGLTATQTLIGAESQVPGNPWSGRLAHCAVWDRVLLPAEVADLAVV